MKTRTNPLMKAALAVLITYAMVMACTCKAQERPDRVVIKGQVLVDDDVRNGSLEVVEVDNRVCVPLLVHPDGRFELVLAAGEKAYLRFEKEGYITKEVLVDTKNANLTREALRKNKLLRFAVQMVPNLPDRSLAYVAPVGYISFLKGTGLMKVRYDRRVVRNDGRDLVMNQPR
jgi:hypothetical protein